MLSPFSLFHKLTTDSDQTAPCLSTSVQIPPITLRLSVFPQLGILSLSGKLHCFPFFSLSLHVSPPCSSYSKSHINVWVKTKLAACFSTLKVVGGRGVWERGNITRLHFSPSDRCLRCLCSLKTRG